MNQPETSARVRRRFDDVAEELAGRGVTVGPMFGVPSLKVGTRSIGCLWGDAVVFKLPPDALAAAMRLKGVAAFDPMGGRPMKEWVVVPSAHASRWRGFAEQALDYLQEG